MKNDAHDDSLVKVLTDYLAGEGRPKHNAEAIHLLQSIRSKQKKAELMGGLVADFCGCDEKFALAGLEFIRELSGSKNAKMRAFLEETKEPPQRTIPDPTVQPMGTAPAPGSAAWAANEGVAEPTGGA